jgi:flavodoxin
LYLRVFIKINPMKTVIIYDSVFGNTGEIARAIYKKILVENESLLCNANEFCIEMLENAGLLIMGSPTRGFRPTDAISGLFRKIPLKRYPGLRVALFDTRLSLSDISSSALRFLVRKGGYAAPYMAGQVKKRGGNVAVPPEGFLVSGEKGPLKAGESERAAQWISGIMEKCQLVSKSTA